MTIWFAIGALVAIWFYFHMRHWATVGNLMTGGHTGTIKLLLMLPFVALLWPLAAYMLISDK